MQKRDWKLAHGQGDSATANRITNRIAEIGREIRQLQSPAATVAELPDENENLIRRLRLSYGLSADPQPVVRIVEDGPAPEEGLVEKLYALAVATADARPAVAAAATRLASLITERPLGEQLEAEIERIERQGDSDGDESSSAGVVEQTANNGDETAIALARSRAVDGAEPEAEGNNDAEAGRNARLSQTGRGHGPIPSDAGDNGEAE